MDGQIDKGPVDLSIGPHNHAPSGETLRNPKGEERLVEVRGSMPRAASSLRCDGGVSRKALHLRNVGAGKLEDAGITQKTVSSRETKTLSGVADLV